MMVMQDVIENGDEKVIELTLHWDEEVYSAVKTALLMELIEHNPSADHYCAE